MKTSQDLLSKWRPVQRTLLLIIGAAATLAGSTPARAAVGDTLATITVPVPSPTGIGIGIAVDCDGNLYYNNSYTPVLHKITAGGVLISSMSTADAVTAVPISFGAMAWDNSRKVLWAGTDRDNGAPVSIYTIDPATGLATFQFDAVSVSFGFDDGLAYDGTDDTVWVSDDVSTVIDHFKSDGTYLGALTPTDAGGNPLADISGVLVGKGDLLYLGRDGFGEIVQVKKSDGTFIGSFASPGGRDEDLECDVINFPGKTAIWSKDAYNDTITAIEVESGTCACGGGHVDECLRVDVYSGFTADGGGAPYSGLVGSFNAAAISFATDTGFDWHPFGLFEFGAEITGFLTAAADGTYTFTLNSDDGSLLLIDGAVVVDNGDPHGPASASGDALLTAGVHCLKVQFFECCGGPSGVDLILPDGVAYTCEPPCELKCPDPIEVCNDAGKCGAIVNYAAPALNCPCRDVTVTCDPPPGSFFAVGTTTVTCTATDTSGQVLASCKTSVTVKDCESPKVDCSATVNPAGKNIPTAGTNPKSGENPDGFYQLLARDNCDGVALLIFVKDSAEGPCGGTFAAGPYAPGTKVKLTQSPGQASVKPMAGVIVAHINTRGDPVLVVTDSAGNTTCHKCLVPRPPK